MQLQYNISYKHVQDSFTSVLYTITSCYVLSVIYFTWYNKVCLFQYMYKRVTAVLFTITSCCVLSVILFIQYKKFFFISVHVQESNCCSVHYNKLLCTFCNIITWYNKVSLFQYMYKRVTAVLYTITSCCVLSVLLSIQYIIVFIFQYMYKRVTAVLYTITSCCVLSVLQLAAKQSPSQSKGKCSLYLFELCNF